MILRHCQRYQDGMAWLPWISLRLVEFRMWIHHPSALSSFAIRALCIAGRHRKDEHLIVWPTGPACGAAILVHSKNVRHLKHTDFAIVVVGIVV